MVASLTSSFLPANDILHACLLCCARLHFSPSGVSLQQTHHLSYLKVVVLQKRLEIDHVTPPCSTKSPVKKAPRRAVAPLTTLRHTLSATCGNSLVTTLLRFSATGSFALFVTGHSIFDRVRLDNAPVPTKAVVVVCANQYCCCCCCVTRFSCHNPSTRG